MNASDPLDAMEKIPRTMLRESAKVALRGQIISGAIQAERIYSIGEAALRLGTSITPVREALVELESLGLVDLLRNRGFRVRIISPGDMADILEMRLLLEVPAMQRLAARPAMVDFARARQLCHAARDAAAAGDLCKYLEVDRQFHLALATMAGNKRLTLAISNLRDQTRLYGMTYLDPSRLSGSADEHDRLLDRIAAGDPDGVGTIMREHLSHILEDWYAPVAAKDRPPPRPR